MQEQVLTRSRLKTAAIVGIAIGAGWIAFAVLYRLMMRTGIAMEVDGCSLSQRTVQCEATPTRWMVFSVTARNRAENALQIIAEGLPPAATFAANGKGGYLFTWLPVVRPERSPDITLKVSSGSRDVTYPVTFSWKE